MRLTSAFPLAAATSALALVVPAPDGHDIEAWQSKTSEAVKSWTSDLRDDFDALSSGVEDALSSARDSFRSSLQDAFFEVEEHMPEHHLADGHHGRHGKHDHDPRTIYQIIKESKYTERFASLVDDYPSVVDLLNSTTTNRTLFVPVNEAFEHIPDHGKKPSKEFVEALLKYHIGEGLYPAGRILATHTLPTALEESWLGGEPQRLRTRVGLAGVRVNFYDKVVYANKFASNGVIHGVNHILVPPPMVGKLLTLFPAKFSSLLLAYEKTNFVDFIHNVPMEGSTVFAPSNSAFEKLGPAANAFLFNSEKGLKYLKALLKYHIAANETLYSDAYYGEKDMEVEQGVASDDDAEVQGWKHYHVDLPSLLDEKSIAVDIFRWGGFIDLKVNGHVHVSVQDGVARNGVIHVVDNVLLPHRKPGSGKAAAQEVALGEISVEELKEMLAPHVEDGDAIDGEWSEL